MRSLADGTRMMRLRCGVLAAFAALAVVALGPAVAADTVYRDGGFEFRIGPRPAWVKDAPALPPVDVKRAVPGGVAVAVADFQYRFDPAPSTFDRRVIVPVDASGLQSVAHIQVEFNPAFSTLTLHDVSVLRDGKRTSRLAPDRVRLIQRERDLEKRVYDGTVTATLVLEDVRVGDAIDYSYTIEGINPLWPPKVATLLPAGGFAEVLYARTRLVAAAGRPIKVLPRATDAKAVRAEEGAVQEWLWEQRNVRAADPSENVPASFPLIPLLQFSEIADWNEIVLWGLGLFDVPSDLAPELQKRADDWMAASTDPKVRAAEALRYVQREIRYFGVELGTGALKPRHPNETARTGFGDCKDKSILLAALLRRMGIEANPTLASLHWGHQLDQMLPSAKLFDHMVTEASFGTERLYLDATQTWQGGDLEAMAIRAYGSVLPIAAGRGTLVTLDRAAGPPNVIERHENFVVAAWDKPVSLHIESVYRGIAANVMRALAAQVTGEQLNRASLEFVQRRFKGATQEGPVELADDRAANEFTIRQRLQVPEILERAEGGPRMYVVATGIMEALSRPKQETRRAPYALEYPLEYRHRTIVDFPDGGKALPPVTNRIRDAFFTFDIRVEVSERKLYFEAAWKSEKSVVPAADWPAFRAKNEDARKLIVYTYVPAQPAARGMLEQMFGTAKYVHDHHEKREAIEKTSKEILSGKLSGDSLAEAYHERGIYYSDMNMLDEAKFDLDKSLALRPGDGKTMIDRALVATAARRYDDSERDFDRALALDPLNGRSYQLRGFNRYLASKWGPAAEDFRRSLELSPPRGGNYPLLWLYLATLRSGGDPQAAIRPFASTADPSDWPYPVLKYFEGSVSVEALLAAAKVRDEKTALFQFCEAYYFVGTHALAKGDVKMAREYFAKSIATDVREFMEWRAAGIELDKIKN